MITRRRLLTRATGAAAASTLGFPAITSCAAPNSKLNIVFIGVGGRGGSNIKEITGISPGAGTPKGKPAAQNKDGAKAAGKAAPPPEPPQPKENVVALCDVNLHNLEVAASKFPEAKKFRDFRKLYDSLKDPDFDAVVVSTCEHTHAYATLPALLRKKPVYCEKPLTRDVHEARLIAQAAAKAGVATQMGTQIHGLPNYRRVVELVQSGAIGAVTECHVWVSRAWGLQSQAEAEANKDIVFVTQRPKEGMAPPPFLDWDLWLGPAPWRPYHEVYFPGPKWYRWWDFGNGTMSDLGSHWNDLPWWALKLDAPLTIEARSEVQPHPEIAPASMTAIYHYGPRGDMPACKVTWHQGNHKPDLWKTDPKVQAFGSGVIFVGSKGMIVSDYSKHALLPEDQFKDFQRPAPFITDSPGQHADWQPLRHLRRATV